MVMYTLLLAVWLDCMGSMMVQPLIPFLALQFGADPSQIGFMQSFFSLMQVFGTFTMGRLADKYGESLVLRGCLLSSTLSLAAFGLSQNFTQLLIFRGLSGFFAGTLSVCQSMLAGMSETHEERVNAMSKMGVVQGAGFCLGPGIGGLLSVYGFPFVAFSASGLTLLNFILASFTLPKDEPQVSIETGGKGGKASGSQGLLDILKSHPSLITIYAAMFLQNFAFSDMTSIMPLLFKDLYGYDGKRMGNVLFVAGMCMIVMQQLITNSAVKHLGEKSCLMIGCAARSVAGYVLVCFVASWIPRVIPALNASGGALINPCLLSLAAACAPSNARGTIMGALQSSGSLGMFFGPTTGGVLYGKKEWWPFMLSANSNACVILLVFLFLPKEPKTQVSESLIPKEESQPVITRRQSYVENMNLEHHSGIHALCFKVPEHPIVPHDFEYNLDPDHGQGYGFFGRQWLAN